MTRLMITLSALAVLGAVGCDKKTEAAAEAPAEKVAEKAQTETPEAAEQKLPELSVDQVDTLLNKKDAKVAVVDANGDDTRKDKGTIPGAILLTSFKDYDVKKELPADMDTKLVFYCGSTSCTASDGAAHKAIEAGYKDVNVLRAGIKGWVDAGKKTAAYAPAEGDKAEDAKEG